MVRRSLLRCRNSSVLNWNHGPARYLFSSSIASTIQRRTDMAHRSSALVVALAGIALVPVAMAQTPVPPDKPSFEVASVKPNMTGDNRVFLGSQPGGGITATNLPLR